MWDSKASSEFDFNIFNEGGYVEAVREKAMGESISKVLYPNDSTENGKELRLVQQYFFVTCSLKDIMRRFLNNHSDWSEFPEFNAIQLNDTHPAIAIPELMRLLMDVHNIPAKSAFEITRSCISYTNHTLLPEALEHWPLDMFKAILPRHFQIIEQIDDFFVEELRSANVDITADRVRALDVSLEHGGAVRMGNLAFIGSHKVNGVSALHTDLMTKTVFADLHKIYPGRIVNITSGVTPRRWL